MDRSSTPDIDSPFLTSSVSSVLGVKGPLRFRPHGSNQKAHVVLRRVTLSDNSSDHDLSTVVRFSLFAQKRIEVKPGKEILLTVASEDGKFGDLPIVFEGDRASPQTSEEDDSTQFADEERQWPLNSRVSQAMPPKMRRAWTKKLEVSSSIEDLSSPSTSHTSVGVQAKPFYVHSYIQTQDIDNSTTTGTESIYDPGNFAEIASLSSVPSSSPRRYVSLEVQTDPDVWLNGVASLAVRSVNGPTTNDVSAINHDTEIDRSLSPMELDSSPCSRELSSSPTQSSRQIEPVLTDAQEGQSARPPSPSSSIASSSGAQDMQLSPVGSRSSSTMVKVLDSIPPLSTAANGQANDSYSAHVFGTQPKSHVQSYTVPQLSSHPNTSVSVSTVQTLIPSLPVLVVPPKRVFPVDKNALSASLQTSQEFEYSPRDPLFKESTLMRDWHPYLNSTQLSTVSSHLPMNAVASSSKVTLEHVDSPHHTTGLEHSVYDHERSLEVTSCGENGYVDSERSSVDASSLPPKEPSQALPSQPPQRGSSMAYYVENQKDTSSMLGTSPIRPTMPAEVDNTVTSWLSTFDDRCWDADAVPGLTASYNLKHYTESQKADKPMSMSNEAEGVQRERASQQFTNEMNLSDPSSLKNLLNGSAQVPYTNSSSNCITDGRSNALPDPGVTTDPASLTEQPKVLPLGVYRLCPAERPVSPGPRGVKRERPPTPKATFLPNEILDMVGVDGTSGHSYPLQEPRRLDWPVFKCDYTTYLSGAGNLAVQAISFCSDGSHFALSCADNTLRVWSNTKKAEIARLSHNSPIVDVTWLEGDIGVVTLGEDGIVGKWTRVGGNFWQWAKIVDAGCEKGNGEKACMAYHRDRIAVSFPRTGVKMWIWLKGTWQAQRSILRPNVTAIKFVDDGAALLGGTRDGVLWYCEVPNGTLRAYSFLHKTIVSLDMSPNGSHVLVGQVGGRARLVSTRQPGNRGTVEMSYSLKDPPSDTYTGYPGAVFAAGGQTVLFGSMEGCVLVWDRNRATVSYGLEHSKDDVVQAVSYIDAQATREGWILTGTQQGQLSWWGQTMEAQKRVKLG